MTDKIISRKDGLHYYLAGKEVTEAAYRAVYPPPKVDNGPCSLIQSKPHLSDALAVHPRQISEATESAKIKGVPTEFLPDGRPIMRSRAHQAKYLRAYGFFNRDGGYGD